MIRCNYVSLVILCDIPVECEPEVGPVDDGVGCAAEPGEGSDLFGPDVTAQDLPEVERVHVEQLIGGGGGAHLLTFVHGRCLMRKLICRLVELIFIIYVVTFIV